MYFSSILIFCFLCEIILVCSEVCNPIECFGYLSKVFEYDGVDDSCKKISKIQQCVGLCRPEMEESNIIKGIHEMKLEICANDQDNKLYNKCVDKHKYLLLSCLYESFNINSVDSKADSKLLMCRKVTEAQHCDLSTLVPCSRHANYVAELLLKKLFKPLHSEFCSFTNEEIYALNVTYPVFANDYKNLALCFDMNSPLVDKCAFNKGEKNSVISTVFSYKLCKTVSSFIDCLSDLVKEKCNSQENAFRTISHSLYQNILPKCFPFSDTNRASREKLSNDKYIDTDNNMIKNSSGIFVVHPNSSNCLFKFTFYVSCVLCTLFNYLFGNNVLL